MQFTLTLTAQDYVHARQLSLRPGRGLRFGLYAVAVLLVLSLILCILDWMTTGHIPRGAMWMAGIPAYFLVLYYIVVPWGARRVFKQQKSLHHPTSFIFTEHGMKAENHQGQCVIQWSDFFKWKADSKVVLIYHSSAIFNMFPRHGFATDADYTAFQDLIQTHLGPQKS
jgi:hypothetical protein